MAAYLALLLAAVWTVARFRSAPLAGAGAVTVAVAEAGRWRAGGGAAFPAAASLCAPLWVAERAVCA